MESGTLPMLINGGGNQPTLFQEGDATSESQIDTEQILTLIDEKPTESFVLPLQIPAISTLENQGAELREHTVRDFLCRPMKIGQFTWDSTQEINAEIFSFSFPSSMFSQPMIAEKIAGFAYIRGDIHVRLQINSQNFQAGMFQLRYFPVLSPSPSYNSQLLTMEQFSGLPGIDINLQGDSPMSIKIPFVYPNDMYDIVEEPDDWAQVYARVYAPLRAASATSVSITVWVYFDKSTLELSMPVSATSNTVAKTLKNYYVKRVADLQLGGEQKAASRAGGPIETVAGAVGTIASVASGIPGLGAIAGGVGIVSSIVGTIAGMFGWSKPTSNQTLTQTRFTYVRGMANSDFPDTATQTALMTQNSLVEAKPVYGTDIDEMALDFIVRIPHYINFFNYQTVNEENQRLKVLEINPATLTSSRYDDDNLVTTSLGLVSSCFELWRGSINLTFKFAKTQFHSGRLIFVWFNTSEEPPMTYEIENAKNPAIQLDLHENFEIDINIPYVQSTPWLNIHSFDSDFKTSNGWLAVYVVNKLQAASAASTSVNCVIECRAGSDFEVAIPKSPELLGYWINPVATYTPPTHSYVVVKSYVVDTDAGTYTVVINFPWEISDTTLTGPYPNDPTGTFTTDPAPVNTIMRLSPFVRDVDISGNELTFVVGSLGPDVMTFLLSGNIVGSLGPVEFTSSVYPLDWMVLYSPLRSVDRKQKRIDKKKRIFADLQISRDESYTGKDGISILPSASMQDVTDVNKDTTGETVKSIRLLLKRYQPESNSSINLAFGRDFLMINPDNFSSLAVPSASYMSLFYPAYRFWRGSKRYKYVLNSTSVLPKLYPYYLLPNYDKNVMTFDPRDKMLSTNLFYNYFEGALEFSVPYYNRNRITISGDVTDDRLLSPMHKRIAVDFTSDVSLPDALLYANVGEDFTFGMYLGPPLMVRTQRT